MDEPQPQPPVAEPPLPAGEAQRLLDELRPRPANTQRLPWRGLALSLAALLALGVGGAYAWQWAHGVRGLELLRFVSVYLCLPLGASLLLLFAALQKQRSR